MPLAYNVERYATRTNARASIRLCQRVVNLGLSTLWLYYRSLGIENTFFKLLTRVQQDVTQIKELLYGIDLVNQSQKFFPHTPIGLLDLKIPQAVYEAQIVPSKADSLAFVFDNDTLATTLQEIMRSNVMITIGNHYRAVSLVQDSNKYYLFNADYQQPAEFTNLSLVAQHIMQYLAGDNSIDQQQQALIIQTLNMPNTVRVNSMPQILTKLLQDTKLHDDFIKEGLRFAVEAGDQKQVQIYQQAGIPLDLNYMGDINLLYIAWHKTHSANDMFNFLLKSGAKLTSGQKTLLEDVLPSDTFKKFIDNYNDYNHGQRSNPSVKF